MKNTKIFHHTSYYFIELGLLIFGFALLFIFASNLILQLIIMVGMLVVYTGMGVLHHKIHHDLSFKIVIEYILVSALVLAALIFLNISRI